MLRVVERLKVRLAVAFVWRKKSNVAEAIRGFQATEVDGVWHLHRGLARLTEPKQRAILFAHSLEEESHAEEFASSYAHYGERPLVPAAYERMDLYPEDAPAWKTFAYVHVGEHDATERFRLIRDALDEKAPLRDSLARIVQDEEGHVDLTHQMLVSMGATEKQIRKEVRRVRLSRLWQNWLRVGKRMVDSVATILLTLTYFVLGPFIAWVAKKKLANRFVEYDNNRLKQL
jgi:hypothetical protein